MTSFLENLKPQLLYNRLLTSIELSRQFNTHWLWPIIRNPAVKEDFWNVVMTPFPTRSLE